MSDAPKRNWRLPLDKIHLGPVFGLKDAYHPNGHRGTDYNGVPEGTPVKAVADGMTVVAVKDLKASPGLGNSIVLQIGSRFFGYHHLHEAPTLKVGDKVNAGDVVGKLGNTGTFSHGAHLHFTLSDKVDGGWAGNVFDADKFLHDKMAAEKAGA
jgi:murein DD-endopeptidase MepM/ murein hydrolase activator NlpD